MTPAAVDEVTRIRSERELYLQLLELGRQPDIASFLHEALALIVELGGATRGYLELHGDDERAARWWTAHGYSPDALDGVRTVVSRGIIAEAIATGKVVETTSALEDERFSSRPSVREGKIEAVLCVPIGEDPPRGVLYLQGPAGSALFAPAERARAELFAGRIAPIVDLVIARERSHGGDSMARLRQVLRLDGIIGRSPALVAVLRDVATAAPLDVSVLLTGETGTGKSQLARLIHLNSGRAGQAFVEVNCATLPENLVESELFGAEAGAHSTATRRIEGKVGAAQRGTLFLDEVTELSMVVQAKLLQLLQSRTFYPLGSSKPVHADVRVIAASNTDLEAAVAEKKLREDLFYRLQVLPIRMPSLEERREDIVELANHFVATTCTQHRLPPIRLSSTALRALECAPWPGNVRQLANTIEAGVIRAVGEGAGAVEQAHMFPDDSLYDAPAAGGAATTFQEATRRFQRAFLADALRESGWNIAQTARRLDLARTYVYTLIRAFGLQREA
jgi:Nif-specific regulatory protein